jgi:hypothetical protein
MLVWIVFAAAWVGWVLAILGWFTAKKWQRIAEDALATLDESLRLTDAALGLNHTSIDQLRRKMLQSVRDLPSESPNTSRPN